VDLENKMAEEKAESVTVKRNKKILTGEVVSNKMDKTIVVSYHRRKLHPLYKKYITVSKKVKAHDAQNECGVGDVVRVIESRPLSKEKRWRLLEILEKAEPAD
jgi:small subunit ribosomal protein S17